MKTAVLWLALSAALVITAPAQNPPGQQGSSTSSDTTPGTIRGRITAADTGKPLVRARISITSTTTPGRPLVANTNVLGQFETAAIPPGTYFVSAARSGFLTVQYGQRRSLERGLAVEVRPGQTTDRIDIALPRGGVLAGRITDELGEPYPGINVDVLALRYRHGKRQPSPAGGTTTDDRGQFRVAGLQPGSYYIVASSNETWRTDQKETFGYAQSYYPGRGADTAQVITLGPSAQRTDLAFSLLPARAARIRGRMQRENGDPVPAAQVGLMYSYPGLVLAFGARFVRTQPSGDFEITNVPAGTYSVGTGGASQIVTVNGVDIDDVVLVARTGSAVSGAVITEDGTPPPLPASGTYVVAETSFDDVLPRSGAITIESDWTFKYPGLGGRFLFRMRGLPDTWAVASVKLNDKDITDVHWDVPTGGKELSGLRITLTQKIARLSGEVVDAAGRPSSAATVLVFADDSALWLPGSRFVRATRPGADGRFSLVGLPPSTYRAIVRDFIEDGQWEDPAFLESLRDEATRVVLGEGASETLVLKLPVVR